MIDREKVISNLEHINTLVTVDSKSPAGARYSQPLLLKIKQWTEEALELLKQPEVVRCKDCKNGYLLESDTVLCSCIRNIGRLQDADWFCADGKRKEST